MFGLSDRKEANTLPAGSQRASVGIEHGIYEGSSQARIISNCVICYRLGDGGIEVKSLSYSCSNS